ncbi:hypothetical protein ACA30_20950, partial [Virgibacillus soli]
PKKCERPRSNWLASINNTPFLKKGEMGFIEHALISRLVLQFPFFEKVKLIFGKLLNLLK